MQQFGPITQLGYLVPDLDAAAAVWSEVIGVGPWTKLSGVKMQAIMDGQPSEITIDLALSYQGDVQIELIQPLCDSPSPYLENKKHGVWGAHHTQFIAEDLDAAIERAQAAGLETACVITSGGARYFYMRSAAGWIELTAPNPGLAQFYALIKKSCTEWDGQKIWNQTGA